MRWLWFVILPNYRLTKKIANALTYYIRDAQGNSFATYKKIRDNINNYDTTRLIEQYLYASSRLGVRSADIIVKIRSTNALLPDSARCLSTAVGAVSFEQTNHLGDVVVTLSDKVLGADVDVDNAIDYYKSIVKSASLTYPFGWDIPNRKFSAGQDYRFGFNGKEIDAQTNSLDFGARNYDARIARWWSVDPMKAKFPESSPYVSFNNSPIITIDPNGKENIVVVAAAYKNNPGNVMNFPHHAISTLTKYKLDESQENTTILIVTEGYTRGQLDALRETVEMNRGKLIEVTTFREIANYINSKNTENNAFSVGRENDLVSNIDIFSHGFPNSIELRYNQPRTEIGTINRENLNQVNPKAFNPSALVQSFACRTGMTDEDHSTSLAQEIANVWDVDVNAFKRRSEYSATLGGEHTRKNPMGVIRHINAPIPPEVFKQLQILDEEYTKFRAWKPTERMVDGAIYNPKGAAYPVTSGSTPSDQPSGIFKFSPKK